MENITLLKEKIESFLNKIIENTSLNMEYKLNVDEEKIDINFDGEDAKLLKIKNFKYCNNISLLLFKHIEKDINEEVEINIDVFGVKEKRIKTISRLIEVKQKEVEKFKNPIKLKPMQAYERKIAHQLIEKTGVLTSESVGNEPNRCVVIKLKNNEDMYSNEEKNNFKTNGFGKKRSFKPKGTR